MYSKILKDMGARVYFMYPMAIYSYPGLVKKFERPSPKFLAALFGVTFGLHLIFTALFYSFKEGQPAEPIEKFTLIEALAGFESPEAEKQLIALFSQYPNDHDIFYKIVQNRVAMEGAYPELHFGDSDQERFDSLWKNLAGVSQIEYALGYGWYVFEKRGLFEAEAYLKERGYAESDPLLLGEMFYKKEVYDRALTYFLKAWEMREVGPSEVVAEEGGDGYNERYVAWFLIKTRIFLKQFDAVDELLREPVYQAVCGPSCLTDLYTRQGRYLKMIPALLKSEWGHRLHAAFIVSLATAAGWVVFLLAMGLFQRWSFREKWLAPAAVVLGFISADVTLAAVVIQDHVIGFGGDEFATDFQKFAYYLAGVGAREELIKLLLFLPIALFLRFHKGEDKKIEFLLAFTLAALVGLGFAAAENVNYYREFGGVSVLGRFMTANFAHAALTGYAGYFLVRALKGGADEWSDCIIAAVKVIVAHGLYDFFLSIENGGFFATIVYILITRDFLRLLISNSGWAQRRLSLPAAFIFAFANSAGLAYFLSAKYMGLGQGLYAVMVSMVGVAFILAMFLHEMQDEIVKSG